MPKVGQPREFDIRHPGQWSSHLGQVTNYLRENQIVEDGLKVATLLCISGPAIYDLAKSLFSPMPIDTVPYKDLMQKLNGHFKPRMFVLAWWFQFDQRVQQLGESASEFIAALRQAARLCQFSNLDERLRDRLVCGLRDKWLQQRLFTRPDITLQDAQDEILADEVAGGGVQAVQTHLHKADELVNYEGAVYSDNTEEEETEIDLVRRRPEQPEQ